jgi:hypothetical protein
MPRYPHRSEQLRTVRARPCCESQWEMCFSPHSTAHCALAHSNDQKAVNCQDVFSIPTNNMHGSASRSASVSSSLFYSQDHFDTIFIPNPQDHSLSKIPGPALSMAIHLRHRSHRRRRRNRWKHRRVRWRQDGDGRWRGWIWGQQTPRKG